MKTIPFLALFATLILTSSYVSTVIASPAETTVQVNNGFDHFRIHRQGNDVALSWAVSAPGVTSFIIERSYDGEFFDAIAEVGAAGGTNKWQDANVYGGTYFYRITAINADGSRLHSDVASVRIVRRK